MELLDVFPLAQGGWDGGGLDDLNAWEPNTMARSHFLQTRKAETVDCQTFGPLLATVGQVLPWILLKRMMSSHAG